MPNRVTLRTLRTANCVLRSSYLSYLDHATPYVGPNDAESLCLLEELIAQQTGLAQGVAGMIRGLGSEEDLCDFPAEYTGTHDLAIGYALRRAAKDQRGRVEKLAELRLEQADPKADALLDETVHHADAIADQLERATEDRAKPTATVA